MPTPISSRVENSSPTIRTIIEEMPSKRVEGMTYERRTKQVLCCREWLTCNRFTVTCDHCGADYNMSGHRLAPREHWGEETGEHWSECY
jgi:hypothetical protein